MTLSPFGFNVLATATTDIRETFTYVYQFITKGYDKEYVRTSRWKRCTGQGK